MLVLIELLTHIIMLACGFMHPYEQVIAERLSRGKGKGRVFDHREPVFAAACLFASSKHANVRGAVVFNGIAVQSSCPITVLTILLVCEDGDTVDVSCAWTK